MTARYFEAPDGWNEPTLWEHDPARPDYPQPILSRHEIAPAYRQDMWPLIVEAVTSGKTLADAWAEGHRAALDGVFPLRREDNPYRGQP